MQHEPRSLLCDTKRTMNFPRTDTVLAVSNHPHYGKPLVQPERRILKDGPSLDAELGLWMAGLTLPQTPGRNKGHVASPASWAHNTIWPPTGNQIGKAVVGIREIPDGLGQRLRFACHA